MHPTERRCRRGFSFFDGCLRCPLCSCPCKPTKEAGGVLSALCLTGRWRFGCFLEHREKGLRGRTSVAVWRELLVVVSPHFDFMRLLPDIKELLRRANKTTRYGLPALERHHCGGGACLVSLISWNHRYIYCTFEKAKVTCHIGSGENSHCTAGS